MSDGLYYPKRFEGASPLAFILNNQIRNENGSLIEVKDHNFLRQPYDDMSPEQVAIKAAQVGWSVLAINKALWLPHFKKANVIYTLPSKSVVKDFVTPKVDPIIIQNPVYRDMVGSTDSIALKSIGERFVYFRGSWEESAAISISAHVLINDEADRSNQKVLQTYQSRLDDASRENPELVMIWQFSNPSIPGYGVDEKWQMSDQKHWFVKCPHCTYDWYLKWPDSINLETEEYICTKCHGVLDNDARRKGRWVAKKDSDISGYWISQMIAPWHSASKIIKDSKKDQQTFFNFTLGLPYVSSETNISRKTITDCLIPGSNPLTKVAIGVDVGIIKTVVIGNAHGIFKVYETENWDDIIADIKRYSAHCVIDLMPYPLMPRKLTEMFRGKVFTHRFDDQTNLQVINWGKGDKQYTVESDRTQIIDQILDEFLHKNIVFNLTIAQLEQYIYDWGQLYRTIKENTRGIKRPYWETIEGRRDHYAFATIYWYIAMQKTYSGSGVVKPPDAVRDKSAPFISPTRTVPAIDLKDIIKRSDRKNSSWKTQ